MNIQPHHYLQLSETERVELATFWDEAFPADVASAGAPEHFAEPELVFVARVDGALAAVVAVVRRTVTVGAEEVEVGMIGGVATGSDHRGSGMASSLMRAAHELLSSEAVAFGLLQCKPNRVSFYESLGWQLRDEPMFYLQPDGSRHLNQELPMVLLIGTKHWPSGEIDINGLPI